MIVQLSIRNLGLIESLDLDLGPGLQVITGETGVGKTLLLRSLGLIGGAPARRDWIRTGADEARVAACLHLSGGPLDAVVADLLAEDHDPEALLVERRLRRSGRHSTRLNGREVPLTLLRGIGSRLVQICGQRAQLTLLQPREQLECLDRYSGLVDRRKEFRDLYRTARERAIRISEWARSQREHHDRQLYLAHVVGELEEASIAPGERESLERELALLDEREGILAAAREAVEELYDGEDSLLDRLAEYRQRLQQSAHLHTALGEFVRSCDAAHTSLEEGVRVLRGVEDELAGEATPIEELRERHDLIVRLEERHRRRGDELIRYAGEAREELERLTGQESELPEQQEKLREELEELFRRAERLTRARRRGAGKLERVVAAELADLGMASARFQVRVTPIEDRPGMGQSNSEKSSPRNRAEVIDSGMATPTALLAERPNSSGAATAGVTGWHGLDEWGADRVEYAFGPNPGEPPRPLRETASGGELSRVLLALERTLAEAGRVPILVFDEIDSGVGGRLGTALGRKLSAIARSCQVLCVTHLPQVACFGDGHHRVDKKVSAGRTRTVLETLEESRRVEELAAMIRGEGRTETSLAEAREMLSDARRD